MNIYSLPIKPAALYVDKIQNKGITYNPLSEKGLLVVGESIASIIKLCDGSQDIASIAKKLSISGKDLFKIVRRLADYDALYLPGHITVSSAHGKKRSLQVWVHTTNACNLNCHYCYVKKDKHKMTIEVSHKLVDALHRSAAIHKDITTISYVLAGGEPFINLDVVKEFLNYSKAQTQKSGLRRNISIITNGTILNDEIIGLLKCHNPGLSVSLDGLGNMNRNRLFKNSRNTTNVILRNIEKLIDAGARPFILITITPENINGLLEFIKYILERELSFSFNLETDLRVIKHLKEFIVKLIPVLMDCYDLMEGILPECSRHISHKFDTISFAYRKQRGCSLAKQRLVISHDGKVYLCQMDIGRQLPVATIEDEDVLGSLQTQTLYPELNEYESIDNYTKCSVCNWRYQCGGGCSFFTKMVSGFFNKPSPYCLVYQRVIPRLIRIKALNFIADQRRNFLSRESAG